MVRYMNKKKRKYTVLICVCLLVLTVAAGIAGFLCGRSGKSANLALQKGVTATSDSTENEELLAYKAIDGDDSTLSSRWSSENNWEDASHYIQLEFPEEISVSFVVLKWERRNVISYALEGSLDGEDWHVLQSFDTAPEMKNQEIALEEPVTVRFLRLSTYEVSKSEEDYSNLYQNISLYEFEVYADKPAAWQLEMAEIGFKGDGSRYLVVPDAPEGYEVTYLGADYEQIIGEDGTIYDTIQEKEVTVGFLVRGVRDESDAREIAQVLTVPAYTWEASAPNSMEAEFTDGQGQANQQGMTSGQNLTSEQGLREEQELTVNECPNVIPALSEWKGGTGTFVPSEDCRVIVEEGSALLDEAELFADKYEDLTRRSVEVISGGQSDVRTGDIYLGYAEGTEGLGEEGYFCDITDKCVIRAQTDTGIRWGTVTLLQILGQDGQAPQGQIRDYPRYEVRGFGIDVARKAVSMDTLYAMMETMSYYKMNDLTIHLNDNVILSTIGLNGSVEEAMTADSAFRLESEIENEDGRKLTSQEYAYTKEEFAQFIEDARSFGVTVVPEIDTPAHSLALTQLFPEYALNARVESVDQIDLNNADAVELVRKIWQEALTGEKAAFRDARIVNIGMDEYYGDGEQYRKYLNEIAGLVRSEGKTVRLWGSLSNIAGTTVPDPENLQMNLWSTVWADPREMYEAGYSLINMQNNHLYVIPGGGYDYLDVEELYQNWEPNKFYDYNLLEMIPAYSPRMLGAVYMMWNDMSGRLDVGISEYDLYERFEQPLAVLAAKLWGEEAGLSYEEFSAMSNRIDQVFFRKKEEKNRIYEEKTALEPYYEVEMRVRLAGEAQTGLDESDVQGTDEVQTEANENGAWAADDTQHAGGRGQVIAENDSAYGEWAFYAAEPETGKVGFSREGRTYTWEYKLPRDEWVELKVVGESGRTTLYVNGESMGTLGNETEFEEYATFVFPMERIGRETGKFDGEVEVMISR